MKIWLITLEGKRLAIAHPEDGADRARVSCACPACGATEFDVQGKAQRPSADDRAWEADGVACCCGASVGIIRAEPSTIFGVREDAAVLHGRPRVY